MSVTISIEHAVKKYGSLTVIPDLSVKIANGEFFTLLGPSGCGKTTLLRMVAGFNSIEGGSFRFNDKEINSMEPGKRGIGMVFQNYAIFPNLTVRKNVEFGLKYRNMPKSRMREEADKFMKLVHVDEYAERMPEQLSGGQQQRIALARALVIEPDVLLMDEPLSNLDAKLRVEMRTVIKRIQHEVGITTVYVTHDQEEAMAISDRIAVMKEGNIMQIGRPEEIYRKPANPFVANFIGVSNFVDCTVDGQDPKAASVKLHDGYSFQMPLRAPYSGEVILSARPEQLFFSEKGIPGKVNLSVFLGDFIQYEVQLHTGQVLELNEYTKDVDSAKADGEEVHISFNPKQVSLYRKDTEEVLSC